MIVSELRQTFPPKMLLKIYKDLFDLLFRAA